MLELYTWTTPNGRKVSIMLEEINLPYSVHPVDISKGEQFRPEFLALNPNAKIPALVDPAGSGGERVTVFESGAILIYLAEKSGRLLPAKGKARAEVLQWLMFQMSHVGPMLGQTNHFINQAAEKVPYAIQRFMQESLRIAGVLEKPLVEREFLAGDYSIADIATYPWISAALTAFGGAAGEVPNLRRWCDRMAARPAVQRGMKVPA